jgi:hypothetical protein
MNTIMKLMMRIRTMKISMKKVQKVIFCDDDEWILEEVDTDTADSQERFEEVVGALCGVWPAVARVLSTPQFEDYPGGVLDIEVVDLPDARWQYMVEAAQRNVLYLRSCRELIEALGIVDIEQRDSHTFALRMKPQATQRFHPNYEWIPPSRWIG